MRPRTKRRALASAALASALGAQPAQAADIELNADSVFQGYEVVSPWGDNVLERRRYLQTIGLAAYNLQGSYHPNEPDYRIVVGMRLDADFGINANLPANQAGGETNYATAAGPGVRFIPGLQIAPLDLMYGYVEGRNLAHGVFSFRVGRQYTTDVLGWWAFDGGLLRATTPSYFAVEVYGGMEERGGLPLSTSRFEAQGVWRGNHDAFSNGPNAPSRTDYPSYQEAFVAPAFGAAIESNGPSWIHTRLSYRRVYNTGDSITTQFPEPGSGGFHQISGLRTSQDRAGWSADVNKPDLGALKGGLTYDLYNQLFGSYFASAEAYLGKRVTVGADADYFMPTFDGDSIWNWFAHGPITTVTGRVAVRVTKKLSITGSGGVRLWRVEGNPAPVAGGLSAFGAGECNQVASANPGRNITCTLGHASYDPAKPIVNASGATVQPYAQNPANLQTVTTADGMGNLNANYRFPSGDVALRGMLELGSRGSREGVDVSGEKRFEGGRYMAGGHASVYGWDDPTRPDRDAVSFSYVLKGGFRPITFANLGLEWEHDINRLVGMRYRVMAVLNLRLLK